LFFFNQIRQQTGNNALLFHRPAFTRGSEGVFQTLHTFYHVTTSPSTACCDNKKKTPTAKTFEPENELELFAQIL